MAHANPITRLGGWAGYDVVQEWQEQRAGQSWCVLRLQPVAGWQAERPTRGLRKYR